METGAMESRTLHCPKCQQDVTVAFTPAPLHGGHANLPDAGEAVCLDFGPDCSGSRCAVFGIPRVVMGVRLARSGLRPEQLERVRALCDGCQRVSELQIVDETHALCPDCGAVNRWAMVRLDGDEWLAVTGPQADAALD